MYQGPKKQSSTLPGASDRSQLASQMASPSPGSPPESSQQPSKVKKRAAAVSESSVPSAKRNKPETASSSDKPGMSCPSDISEKVSKCRLVKRNPKTPQNKISSAKPSIPKPEPEEPEIDEAGFVTFLTEVDDDSDIMSHLPSVKSEQQSPAPSGSNVNAAGMGLASSSPLNATIQDEDDVRGTGIPTGTKQGQLHPKTFGTRPVITQQPSLASSPELVADQTDNIYSSIESDSSNDQEDDTGRAGSAAASAKPVANLSMNAIQSTGFQASLDMITVAAEEGGHDFIPPGRHAVPTTPNVENPHPTSLAMPLGNRAQETITELNGVRTKVSWRTVCQLDGPGAQRYKLILNRQNWEDPFTFCIT